MSSMSAICNNDDQWAVPVQHLPSPLLSVRPQNRRAYVKHFLGPLQSKKFQSVSEKCINMYITELLTFHILQGLPQSQQKTIPGNLCIVVPLCRKSWGFDEQMEKESETQLQDVFSHHWKTQKDLRTLIKMIWLQIFLVFFKSKLNK